MVTESKPYNGGGLSPTTDILEPVQTVISANFLAEYEPCITCADLGKNCKGPKLAALGTISNVREYHRRLRSHHQIPIKEIVALTEKEISAATVKDYFSHEEKDFRWATVSMIDNALTVICGDCVGLPPVYIPNCPATSSEIKEKIEKVNESLHQAECEIESLKDRIKEKDKMYAEQLAAFREDAYDRVKWLKSDIKLWRRIAFSVLIVLFITMIALIAFLALDLANHNFGTLKK